MELWKLDGKMNKMAYFPSYLYQCTEIPNKLTFMTSLWLGELSKVEFIR